MGNLKIVLIILFLVAISFMIEEHYTPKVMLGKTVVAVELATTQQQWETGLMWRSYLGPHNGMLFIFDEEQYLNYWMKNMKIQLDVIFIAPNMAIVDIKHDFQPCKSEPCEVYTPSKPYVYVLEVNANFTINHNINIGDKIAFKNVY